MKLRRRICLLVMLLLVAVFGTWKGQAFALLGPFESWMQQTNGLNEPGDIGGPMCISNEYRWNVPVATYGFDKSFLDFFGTNGEAAVESAIQVLNDLPPASQMNLESYPFNSQEYNFAALAPGLLDLKSYTLPLLLEQMGLAQPTRYIFVLRQWNPIFNSATFSGDWPDWVYPNYISQRNYDPETLEASDTVNDTAYAGEVESGGGSHAVEPFSTNPYSIQYNAVADGFTDGAGVFYTGLTYDDVGGLRYLLSTNTMAYETLLPGVTGAGKHAGKHKHLIVNGAWRPGVDKITFVSQPTDPRSGAFLAMTNFYTDTYVSNGVFMHQQLARVINEPDFLFYAGDLAQGISLALFDRTGTTNWINNAVLNGNPGGGGPGVVQPQVKIVFDKLGPVYDYNPLFGVTTEFEPQSWASFDLSTNAPVIYPAPQTGTNQMTVRICLYLDGGNGQSSIVWKPRSQSGTRYALQSSADLINWATLFTVTNNGSVCTYNVANPPDSSQFFRLQLIGF